MFKSQTKTHFNLSNDIITNFHLINENTSIDRVETYNIGISNFITLGIFNGKDNRPLFNKLGIDPKNREYQFVIKNADYFNFFDDDDNINNKYESAPYLSVAPSFGTEKIYFLSKQDMVTVSKFLIRYYEDIINQLKCVEKEILDTK